jgi:SAM-dependent methyltransferase
MSWVIRQLAAKAKRGDWRGLASALLRAIDERFYEWRFNIRSSGYIAPTDLGILDDQYIGYEGTDYRSLAEIMKKLRVREGKDVFLDLGAGKGRALIMAATRPFKRVIGLEISPDLAAIARENLERARKRLRCSDTSVVVGDATKFVVPDDVTIVFMFNPFRGEVLASALRNVRDSLTRAPRALRVAFVNPRHVDAEIASVMSGWLRESEVFMPRASEFRTVIYETSAPAAAPKEAGAAGS